MVEEKEEKKIIDRKHPFIYMDRVPNRTFDAFMKLAKEEFCNDYGMTLKYLVDFYQGIIPVGNEHLELELSNLKLEIEQIKVQLKEKVVVEEKKSTRKMLNGREVK